MNPESPRPSSPQSVARRLNDRVIAPPLTDIPSGHQSAAVALAQALQLCPPVRLGQDFVAKASPQLGALKVRLRRCARYLRQLSEDKDLQLVREFRTSIKAACFAGDAYTQIDCVIGTLYQHESEMIRQHIRLRLLEFLRVADHIGARHERKLDAIYHQPLSDDGLTMAKKLINELVEQLLLQSGEAND